MARIHNELSQVVVVAKPIDKAKQPYTPISAKYKLNDCNTGEQLRGWTDLTPSDEMQIIIQGAYNRIVDDRNKLEVKTVTLSTDEGLETQHYEQYNYKIRNLKFIK